MDSSKKTTIIEINKHEYADKLLDLVDTIVALGIDIFGKGMSKKEVLDQLVPTDRVYIVVSGEDKEESNTQELVGFASATLNDYSLYLAAAVIKSEYRGREIYLEFNMRRVMFCLENNKATLTTFTQNPLVEEGIKKTLDQLIASNTILAYTIKREIKKGLYERMLTRTRPLSRSQETNSTYSRLNYQRGDAFSLEFLLER